MNIGDRIKYIRERKGLTQQELSKASGVSQQMISKLETGKAQTTVDIVKLACALDVSATWLQGISKYPQQLHASTRMSNNLAAETGVRLNRKAIQVCIEYLAEHSRQRFTKRAYREKSQLFVQCYTFCTQRKNVLLKKTELLQALIKQAGYF